MKKKIINSLFITSLIFYIGFLLWIIIFKYVSPLEVFSKDRYFTRSISFIPFNDILNGNYNSLDIIGNVILFIPTGIYIPILSKEKKLFKLIGKIAFISLIFEMSQYIFGLGASDITDIITNTLGGIIGMVVYLIIRRIFKDDKKVKAFVSICSTMVMIPVAFILVMTFIYN